MRPSRYTMVDGKRCPLPRPAASGRETADANRKAVEEFRKAQAKPKAKKPKK